MASSERKNDTFESRLRRSEGEISGLLKEIGEIRQIDKHHRSLQVKDERLAAFAVQVADQNTKIAALTDAITENHRSVALERNLWTGRNEELQKEFDRDRARWQNTKQTLENARHKVEIKLKRADEDARDSRTRLDQRNADFGKLERELGQMLDDIGIEKLNIKFFEVSFHDLAIKLHELSKRYVGLPMANEANQENLGHRRQSSSASIDIRSSFLYPIPFSDSDASRRLRVAAFEWVVSRHLETDIFNILPQAYSDNREHIETLLDTLLTRDPRKEAIIRSALVSASRSTDDEIAIADLTVGRIIDGYKHIVPYHKSSAELEANLKDFLIRCLAVWNDAQRCEKRIATTMRVERLPDSWKDYDGLGDEASSEMMNTLGIPDTRGPELALFPQISVLEDRRVLYGGYAVWGNEEAIVSGKLECCKQKPLRSSRRRRSSVPSSSVPSSSVPSSSVSGKRRDSAVVTSAVANLENRNGGIAKRSDA